MKFSDWKPLYLEIIRDFSFDARADEESARRLDSMLGDPSAALSQLEAMHGKRVTVVGPAISPFEAKSLARPFVVAGSAVSPIPIESRPLALVTDLDGDAERTSLFSARGAVAIVHAHGDNISLLESVRALPGPLLGTCQCAPVGRLRNYGGFTDGDRAAFLAEAFGAESVDLVGFDFEHPIPKPGADPEVKRRKLAWARRLLGLVRIPVTMGGKPFV